MGRAAEGGSPKLALIYLTSLIRSGGRRNLIAGSAKLTQYRRSKIADRKLTTPAWVLPSGGAHVGGKVSVGNSGFVSDDRMETILAFTSGRDFFGAVPHEALHDN